LWKIGCGDSIKGSPTGGRNLVLPPNPVKDSMSLESLKKKRPTGEQ